MSNMNEDTSELEFAPEDDTTTATPNPFTRHKWKVLIVDDEPAIHDITRIALQNVEFDGRHIEFLHAYSGEEARRLLEQYPDTAVALVDVVMESEHAGLDLVRYIREEVGNHLIRIILRTGQPGQAPERAVIRDYDINDYKEKTELTAQKLYSTVYTSLRSYRDLAAIDANRRGLEHVIHASAHLFRMPELTAFIQGVLEQLVALLYLCEDSVYLGCDCVALETEGECYSVVAATGRFSGLVGADASALEPGVAALIQRAHDRKKSIISEEGFVGYFRPRDGREDLIYVHSARPLGHDDLRLIELFLHNASIAYENAILRDEIEGTQRDMVYMLGEAIETRSRETGQHVRRVAEYCRLIARGMGLSEREAEILHVASPLHDFGKIGIPDAVLHKSGKLDETEWELMRSHATIGYELLDRSEREILKAAAVIAGQHHERWDGTGYPNGLKGEDIHLYGRIGAVADVFDALGSRRCYKEPWPLEEILKYMEDQRGKHFDPALVDWVLDNVDHMKAVMRQFPDPS